MRIIIFGLGRVGSQLLAALESGPISLLGVDRDHTVCEAAAARSNATIVCGDFTSAEILDSIRFTHDDHVYAVSGIEEANFLAGMYAKHAGASKVVVKVETPAHAQLLVKLGLEPFVGEKMIAQHLSNQVLFPTIFTLLSPGESNLELFEEDVPEKYRSVTVEEFNADKDLHLVALYDGKKFLLPTPDTRLGKATKIIVLSTGKRKAFK